MIRPPLLRHVEWRLVLGAAAFAALAVFGGTVIGGGMVELLSVLASFAIAGYLATHRARNRPLVQGMVTIALALGAIYVGVAVAEDGGRAIARSMILVTPFATLPGAVGVLAGHADRELRPRRGAPSPLAVDDLSRAMGAIWRGRQRRDGAPPALTDESGPDSVD